MRVRASRLPLGGRAPLRYFWCPLHGEGTKGRREYSSLASPTVASWAVRFPLYDGRTDGRTETEVGTPKETAEVRRERQRETETETETERATETDETDHKEAQMPTHRGWVGACVHTPTKSTYCCRHDEDATTDRTPSCCVILPFKTAAGTSIHGTHGTVSKRTDRKQGVQTWGPE